MNILLSFIFRMNPNYRSWAHEEIFAFMHMHINYLSHRMYESESSSM